MIECKVDEILKNVEQKDKEMENRREKLRKLDGQPR